MILTEAKLREVWYAAREQPVGLRLVLADPKDATRLMNELYRIRQDCRDLSLQSLSVCRPAGGKELWIVQQGVDMEEKEPENG